MLWLILIFIVTPVIEMIVLIEVGSVLGSVTTVALVLLTAVVGVALLRRQGLKTLMSFNQKLNSGELPAQEILSAFFLAFAGAFLLTPGFVTDTFGFLLLISPVRKSLADYVIRKGMLKAEASFEQNVDFFQDVEGSAQQHQAGQVEKLSAFEKTRAAGDTLEGDFERKDS